MALTRSLTQNEKEICQRVAAFRRFEHKSQDDLAKAVGLTRDQLANIEIGRTPLRFWIGWKICKELNINQRYLANGEAPQRPFHEFDPIDAANTPISESESFGEACLRKLADELKFRNEMLSDGQNEGMTGDYAFTYEQALVRITKVYFMKTPIKEREAVLEHLFTSLRRAILGSADVHPKGGPPVKKILTDAETLSKVAEVKSQLPSLLERLKKATAETGMKSELAAFLTRMTCEKGKEIPLASISRWLSGEREPGGEVALQMDVWATAQGYPRAK